MVPKLESNIITKQTGVSIALVMVVGTAIYNYGLNQGKVMATDKQLERIEKRLDLIEENQRTLNGNQIRIETIIKKRGL